MAPPRAWGSPKATGGLPLDQIAAELNERGIFTGSADDLLELLKTKERPRRRYYQEDVQAEEEMLASDAAEFAEKLAPVFEKLRNDQKITQNIRMLT